MKLTYRDVVESKASVEEMLAIKPAPLSDVSVKLAINARRISAKLVEFTEARKLLFDAQAEPTVHLTLSWLPTTADLLKQVTEAEAHKRLFEALEPAYEDAPLCQTQPIYLVAERLGEAAAQALAEMDVERFTGPIVAKDGASYVVYLQQRETMAAIPKEKLEAFSEAIETLLTEEVEVDIRPISLEALARSEEKRPGFAIPPSAMYGAWFMFEENGV